MSVFLFTFLFSAAPKLPKTAGILQVYVNIYVLLRSRLWISIEYVWQRITQHQHQHFWCLRFQIDHKDEGCEGLPQRQHISMAFSAQFTPASLH